MKECFKMDANNTNSDESWGIDRGATLNFLAVALLQEKLLQTIPLRISEMLQQKYKNLIYSSMKTNANYSACIPINRC